MYINLFFILNTFFILKLELNLYILSFLFWISSIDLLPQCSVLYIDSLEFTINFLKILYVHFLLKTICVHIFQSETIVLIFLPFK